MFVNLVGQVDVVQRIMQLLPVELYPQRPGDGLLFEIGHEVALLQQMLGGQDHDIYRIDPKPGIEVVVAVLHKEGFQKVVVERRIVVARQKKLVCRVVFINILTEQLHQLLVYVMHRWVLKYLFLGDVADAQCLLIDIAARVGADVEVERLLALAVDDHLAADLVDTMPPVANARRLKIEK